MLDAILKARAFLPLLKMDDGRDANTRLWPERRKELLASLETYSYGVTPPAPQSVSCELLSQDANAYAGKVCERRYMLSFNATNGVCSFPFALFVPNKYNKPPVFLHLAFRRELPDAYVPVEEITDGGFALAVVCYKDMVNDNLFGDYSDGIASAFATVCPRSKTEWGKIGMWAYGASRILDFLLTLGELDAAHTAVIGHSRLGKTVLWAAAQDERFWCAVSNNSGYGGAASSKGGSGERVKDFLRAGSWDWFCENFKDYVDDLEDKKPYDQGFLLALVAPRLLYVGSAEQDKGADPESEFLTALYASQAWELFGKPGLISQDRLPKPGDCFGKGSVGYHLRAGRHFLSREDWNRYMEFLRLKLRIKDNTGG